MKQELKETQTVRVNPRRITLEEVTEFGLDEMFGCLDWKIVLEGKGTIHKIVEVGNKFHTIKRIYGIKFITGVLMGRIIYLPPDCLPSMEV